jgi:hypothetical protein
MSNKFGKREFLSVSSFPNMGGKDEYFYTEKENNYGTYEDDKDFPIEKTFKKYPYNSQELIENNLFTKSRFTNDYIINSHPRFGCLARNIRLRRGKKVEILVPIFKDTNTSIEKTQDEPYPGYIYMDSMPFGMGSSCFQVTIGACTYQGTQYMYDQFNPITPLLVKINKLI